MAQAKNNNDCIIDYLEMIRRLSMDSKKHKDIQALCYEISMLLKE